MDAKRDACWLCSISSHSDGRAYRVWFSWIIISFDKICWNNSRIVAAITTIVARYRVKLTRLLSLTLSAHLDAKENSRANHRDLKLSPCIHWFKFGTIWTLLISRWLVKSSHEFSPSTTHSSTQFQTANGMMRWITTKTETIRYCYMHSHTSEHCLCT